MECTARQAASGRVVRNLLRPRRNIASSGTNPIHLQQLRSRRSHNVSQPSRRYASSSASGPPSPPKQIVLDQPDKFRPPSHAARRNTRSTTAMYGGGAAYNQGMSQAERAKSKQKSYPHMFPNEGTTMHWFLTTRWVHVSITMVCLHYFAGAQNGYGAGKLMDSHKSRL